MKGDRQKLSSLCPVKAHALYIYNILFQWHKTWQQVNQPTRAHAILQLKGLQAMLWMEMLLELGLMVPVPTPTTMPMSGGQLIWDQQIQ